MPRVAACVVTGFLGSGKTTLLCGLLARDPARGRIAVVVNELGEIGIDGRVVAGFEFIENVVELESGCICCSIDEYRFDLAVDELVRRIDPVLLVIETTGVADPAPTLERLRRCGLGVDSVVTVVDATAWEIAWRMSRAARRQIRAADFLVLSKCDIVPAARIARLASRLARLHPRARVLESHGTADFPGAELLFATSAARAAQRANDAASPAKAANATVDNDDDDAASSRAHLDDERFESFVWRTDRPVDRRRLEHVLAALPREVVRAKGFLKVASESIAYLFHAVCGRVEISGSDAPAAFAEGARGVFIGPGILAQRDAILAALASCEEPAGAGTSGPGRASTNVDSGREPERERSRL